MTPAITDTVSWWAPFEALEVGQRVHHPRPDGHRGRRRRLRRAHRRLAPAARGRRSGPRQSPFGERIAHGMLVVSLAAGLVPFDPGPRGRAAPGLRRHVQAPGAVRRHAPRRGPDRRPDARSRGRRPGDVRVERRQPGRPQRLPRARRGAVAPRRRELGRRSTRVARADGFVPIPRLMGMLEGKKLLITGVVNRESIAYEVARQAQEAGAEVVLTSFGRVKRMTERSAAKLPQPPDVLELDVNNAERHRGGRAPTCASAGAASTACCTRSRSRPRTRSAATSSTRRRRAPRRRSGRARSR